MGFCFSSSGLCALVQNERNCKNRGADAENELVDTAGEERAGQAGMHIDGYTLPCVTETASGKPLYGTGNSAWGSVVTSRGRMGLGHGFGLILIRSQQPRSLTAPVHSGICIPIRI